MNNGLVMGAATVGAGLLVDTTSAFAQVRPGRITRGILRHQIGLELLSPDRGRIEVWEHQRGIFWIVALLMVLTCVVSNAQAQRPNSGRAPRNNFEESLGKGFTSKHVQANGISIHYVKGGSGPVVILLHGYPQDWYEWRRVMPALSKKFTVIVPDLRGVGESTPTPKGYDAVSLAEDVHGLIQQLKLGRVYLAGHDIGGMVAYAYLRLHPETLRGVMILDVPIPGLDPWSTVEANPLLWHFRFHQTQKVPEALVAGRQATYFREAFFDRLALDPKAITDQDVAHYARSYASRSQLRAGFEFYRAFFDDAQFNQSRKERIDVPVVLVGGDHAVGPTNAGFAESLKKQGCTKVSVETIAHSVHYVADERPTEVADLIEKYASQ